MLHKRVASLYIKKANIAKAIPANDYIMSDNAFDLGSDCFDRVFGHPFIFNEKDTKEVTHLMKLIPEVRVLLGNIEDELNKVSNLVNEYFERSKQIGKENKIIANWNSHEFIYNKRYECVKHIKEAFEAIETLKGADETMGSLKAGLVAWGDKTQYNSVKYTLKVYYTWSNLEQALFKLVNPEVLPIYLKYCLEEVKDYEEYKKQNSGVGAFFRKLFKKASSSVQTLTYLLAKSHHLGLSNALKQFDIGSLDSGLSVYQAVVYREQAYEKLVNQVGSLSHEDDPFKHFIIANLSKFQNNKHGLLPIDEDISFIHEHIISSNSVVSAWKTMKNNKG